MSSLERGLRSPSTERHLGNRTGRPIRRLLVRSFRIERGRAVALAQPYRYGRVFRSRRSRIVWAALRRRSRPYFYDPPGEKARAVKARYVGLCRSSGAYSQPRTAKAIPAPVMRTKSSAHRRQAASRALRPISRPIFIGAPVVRSAHGRPRGRRDRDARGAINGGDGDRDAAASTIDCPLALFRFVDAALPMRSLQHRAFWTRSSICLDDPGMKASAFRPQAFTTVPMQLSAALAPGLHRGRLGASTVAGVRAVVQSPRG